MSVFETSKSREIPVTTLHRESYAAISPARPELSQAGRAVLVTGGGTGIGYSIACSYAQAGAAAVVLAARREDVLRAAAERLKADSQHANPGLQVHAHAVDIADTTSIAKLWAWLAESGIVVDVLVLNAGQSSKPQGVLEAGLETVWNFYEVNVRGHLAFAEQFHQQKRDAARGPMVLLNVTSTAAWDHRSASRVPIYALTKSSAVSLLQQIAVHVPADTMRIVSFHPGLIKTERAAGFFAKHMPGVEMPWEDDKLPGHFALWLASPEAAFLHGRYAEAIWDVDELQSGKVRERIESDPYYLRVGILGLHP